MDALSLLAGLVVGALGAAWFVARQARTRAEAEQQRQESERQRERQELESRWNEARARGEQLQAEVVRLHALTAAEEQRNKSLQEKLEGQQQELERMQQRMTDQFKVIANELLETKGKQLNEQQQERLGHIVKPLHDRIRDFEEQVRKAYDQEGRERFALKQEILRLVEQNQRLSQEANDLTKALKGDTQAQGAWGEMILERILESSGLMKGQEYTMQESSTQADGSRLRPDAVVHLPDDKHLIIDSKVSLVHYERHASASEEAERERALKQHVESMRSHARSLADKDYTKVYGVRSVDFVLMFVPLEPAFLLALRERPEIFQEAYDRHVVMVTHSTLMATLRTVQGIWKHERIARNHLDIAERAGALYEKFVGFTEDLIKVGQQMDSAKKSYADAMGKLSEGRGNLVRQVEMLKELGAKTNKSIQPALLDRAAEKDPPILP